MVRLRKVVAARKLELAATVTEPAGAVVVSFARPTRVPGSTDFVCFYQITGLSCSGIRRAMGVDSVQALLLAFSGAASILYTSTEYEQGRLTHLTGANLGLPAIAQVFADRVADQKTLVFF